MQILLTDRLLLRHLEPADLDDLFELYRDPEIRRFYPDGTLTREQTQEELQHFRHGHPRHPELGLWATIDRASGEFLGRCGLLPWQIDGRLEIELAFLIKKSRWRQGLATEAARGIAGHAHRQLGLSRLVCLILPGNEASVALATRLGMHFERDFSDEYGPCRIYAGSLPLAAPGAGAGSASG